MTMELLSPQDEFNETLLDNVHPPDWVNPEPKDWYHLVVIGAGAGGLVSAIGAICKPVIQRLPAIGHYAVYAQFVNHD